MNPVKYTLDGSFTEWATDYCLLSAALVKQNAKEVKALLDRPVFFKDVILISALWNTFPFLAIEYLDAYPQFARHCPTLVLEQQKDNLPLITKLFNLGLEITADEYVALSVKYPKIASKVLKELPHLAKECPTSVYERLEEWPQTERVRKVVAKSGAKVERDEAEDKEIPDELVRIFKKTRVAEESDEELPDV